MNLESNEQKFLASVGNTDRVKTKCKIQQSKDMGELLYVEYCIVTVLFLFSLNVNTKNVSFKSNKSPTAVEYIRLVILMEN